MRLSDFDFHLPKELIAQRPANKRDESSLLIQDEGIVLFSKILDYIQDDLVIFNDSKTINAKLILGEKEISVNIFEKTQNSWLAFAKPAKKIQKGDEFIYDSHSKIIILDKFDNGIIELKIDSNLKDFDFLDKYGYPPLPPYIKKQDDSDKLRYQNTYSKELGSFATATAGLHFSKELMCKLQKKTDVEFVTLHIGAGTFLPVKCQNISEHKMHQEWFSITDEVANKINMAKNIGKRIVVIGTTAMRAIESCSKNGIVHSKQGKTDIFITPGYDFQIADILVTNFHLPKSTLFMLICAFAGYKEAHEMYKYAINKKMRFFSYGDAMMIRKK